MSGITRVSSMFVQNANRMVRKMLHNFKTAADFFLVM